MYSNIYFSVTELLFLVTLLCVFLIARVWWQYRKRRTTPAPLVEVLPATPQSFTISPELDASLKSYFAQVSRLPIAQRDAQKERSANG